MSPWDLKDVQNMGKKPTPTGWLERWSFGTGEWI